MASRAPRQSPEPTPPVWRRRGSRRAAVDAVLRFADAVFGGSEVDPLSGGSWLRYLSVTALLVGIVVARRPDAVTTPQFWAEDGYIYFFENATLGFLPALAQLYNGYPNLTQRSIAFLGGLVPALHAPRVYTTSAIALTALSLASFTLPAFRHVVRSDLLRVLFCAAVVSMPFDREILGTPANLGWLLAIWLSLLSMMRLPHGPWRVALLAAAGSCVVFSTPLAAINLPLWLLRVVRGGLRRDRRELAFGLALVAALAAVTLLTPMMGSTTSLTLPVVGPVRISLQTWTMFAVSRLSALVLAGKEQMPSQTAYAVAGIMIAALLATSFVARWRNLPPLLLALFLAFASLALELTGRPLLNSMIIPMRYTVYPTAMLILAVAIALDGLPQGYWRAAATIGVVASVASAWKTAFAIEPFLDQEWPRHAARVEQALRDRCPVHVDVPMNPTFAPLRIDWGPYHREDVLPEQVVATVTPSSSFRYAFDGTCDRLTEVELYLGALVLRVPDTLTLTLFDGALPVAAAKTTPMGMGTNGWLPFCFPPIEGTKGRHLTLLLEAASKDPNASVLVFGHPSGRPSVRHGCLRTVPNR